MYPEQAATVPIKSAWASKINWTQAVALAGTVLTLTTGHDLDPATQAAIVAGIQAVQSVATWVQRTWFTKSVTPQSLPAK